MAKLNKLALIALILAVVCPIIAAAGDEVTVGKIRDLKLTQTVMVGDTALKAGEYRVRHVVQGDAHLVVFLKGRSEEVARVNCTMTKLAGRSDETALTYAKQNDGKLVLRELVFAGEDSKHVF